MQLPGSTIATRRDLEKAARKFSAHYKALRAAAKQQPVDAPQKVQQQQQQQPEPVARMRPRRRSRASAASEAGHGMLMPPLPPQALAPADSWPLRPQQGSAVLRLSASGGSGRVLSAGGFTAGAAPILGGGDLAGGAPVGRSCAAAFSVGGAAPLSGRASSGGGARSMRGAGAGAGAGGKQQQQVDAPNVALARSHSRPLITVETLDCVSSAGCSEVSGVELCEVAAEVVDRDKQRPGWWTQFK